MEKQVKKVRGNPSKLVSLKDRTTQEQREIAKKGGIASGESRREKKTMKETALLLVGLPIKNEDEKEKLKEMGISDDDLILKTAVMVALINEAKSGNTQAMNLLAGFLGEAPAQKQQIEVSGGFKVDSKIKQEIESRLFKRRLAPANK